MVLALRQWCPLAAGWRGMWTGWSWGVTGNRVCVERDAEVSRFAVGTGLNSQDGVGLAGGIQLCSPHILLLH